MASPQIKNYLRSNRKRLALSQGEVAFLIGRRGAAKISGYERYMREPNLRAALALEVIYKRSVSELFDGLYHEVEKEIAERAKILNHRLDRKSKQMAALKRQILTDLAKTYQ
jgi:transcriptional regulator with XRE-family HTH domain